MRKVVTSFKRFVFAQFLLIVFTFVTVFLFDQFTEGQVGFTSILRQVGRIFIVIIFGGVAIFIIRRSKHILSRHVGMHAANVFQIMMIVIACIVMVFAILHIFQVSPNSLLIGGGIVSIVFGLIVSTTVGSLLAGTFVLMTHPYKVGDTVLINNVPCKVEQITSLVTRVRNDFGGQIAIPNTAIMGGNIIVTSFDETEEVARRLPYAKGDRVYTTYMNQEGSLPRLPRFVHELCWILGEN
ncbi:MAG TPA: mechanosensitive ion channel domain-containing protein [Candidatus Thermoplasmatota archaeon]|nr:mechanosensitive ion channel domain-containing protein [Candidatus Thermoplasmatota archaeon]